MPLNTEKYSLGYTPATHAFLHRRRGDTHGWFFREYLQPGVRLLDCGCGPGNITLDLARSIAPGEVIGVDQDAGQIAMASAAAQDAKLSNARFRQANIYALPFADGEFDRAFSHALFEHLADPLAAMREIKRVLRPGGVAGLCAPDWRAFIVEPSSPDLVAAIELYKRIQRSGGGDPDIGGKLAAMMVAAGYSEVKPIAHYECYAPLSIIGNLVSHRLEISPEADGSVAKQWVTAEALARYVQAVRDWQRMPHGLWAQAWVAAIGVKAS
jgi:ubiquinone/menaquinone biosynthesis C-methylase UbiE